jgi:hypothetical protein
LCQLFTRRQIYADFDRHRQGEERALRLLVVDRLELMVLADGTCARDGRARIDDAKPPPDPGECASGSFWLFRTREALSIQPQSDISAIV